MKVTFNNTISNVLGSSIQFDKYILYETTQILITKPNKQTYKLSLFQTLCSMTNNCKTKTKISSTLWSTLKTDKVLKNS